MPTASPVPAALRRPDPVPLADRALWSLQDASRATSLSVRTLQKLIADGRLPAAKVGRRVLLDPAAVRAALLSGGETTPA
jgi:excisionase family DNA binding protein